MNVCHVYRQAHHNVGVWNVPSRITPPNRHSMQHGSNEKNNLIEQLNNVEGEITHRYGTIVCCKVVLVW